MSFRRFSFILVVFISAVCLTSNAFKYENCPGPITVDTSADSATVAVTWLHPSLDSVGGSISQTVSHDPGEKFPIGLTRVNYLAINMTDYRDLQICTFVITVHDPVAPVFITCPINVTSRLGPGQDDLAVVWDVPQAMDNSKHVQLLSTHEPGDNFTAGTVTVTYTARDTSGNEAYCEFPVIVIPFITTTTMTTTMRRTTTASTAMPSKSWEATNKKQGETTGSSTGPVVLTAGPIDWRLWTSRGLIWISLLCLLCFAIIALVAFRRYRAVRLLKKKRGADEEAEIYPSSAGEEYDMWEDPPGGPAYQVNPGGKGSGQETHRLNKAEVRPLLVAGGGHEF